MHNFHPNLREQYDLFRQNGKVKHFLLDALTTGIADGSIKNTSSPLRLAQFIFTVIMSMLQKMVKGRSVNLHLDKEMTEELAEMLLHHVCRENKLKEIKE
ncbi:hypothetical protein [Paenibacillus illinoisensis]|uniref:hypothetical protein n=1 Tax=Paenibacillus illinoisensis TaxID=59845 RepID=UPI000FD90D6C|nr:hypothetical protein [Paenibacillus illinoisensis]